MAKPGRKNATTKKDKKAEPYRHVDADSPMRPEVGTQPQFRKKKPPRTYRYDSSLSPAMDWDGQNFARELGEWLLRMIEEASRLDPPYTFPKPQQFNGGQVEVRGLDDAIQKLKALSGPFLNWSGKAERLSFDVPTLPLFVHERLSTKAIIETLKTHQKDKGPLQDDLFRMFGDPRHSIADQVIGAYEHRDQWVNRMILGDSLVAMNSLLEYESLGGQVQMIYMDPPYGIKFGSNFQPFVRNPKVKHNDDDDMTREPEMVQAYRDTWDLGLHSYFTYLRDRLLLSRELLSTSGSIFVQIGDENVHRVRSLMDEVFGEANFAGIIPFRKTGGLKSRLLDSIVDYLLWYAKDKAQVRYRQIYQRKVPGDPGATQYTCVVRDGELVEYEGDLGELRPEEVCTHGDLTSQGNPVTEYVFKGQKFKGGWKTTNPEGLDRLAGANRLANLGKTLRYVRYLSDFPFFPVTELWDDTGISGFGRKKSYVVETNPRVIERCVLMTTDPGDLVLDPTCGSGTTAYVAEQWGRRWITGDVSRVPLALARQRLLTATFPWFELKEDGRGPAGGFSYKRKRNKQGEEVGGIVPQVTLEGIAKGDPPTDIILVDNPSMKTGITRVSGPFSFEATIPTPIDWEDAEQGITGISTPEEYGSYVDRMIEVLRKSPVLRLEGNRTVALKNVRLPAKSLSLSGEALMANGEEKPVAFVFGPENGAVSEKLVFEAGKEANAKGYRHLFVIGFGIQPNARQLIESSERAIGVPATYVEATRDIMMGDLLKNMRSSQIFSVCGLPDVKLSAVKGSKYEVELLGLDVFDPITMDSQHRSGNDVPAWFLDTDYNGLCFHVSQAFFPRTLAWESLKKALKATHEESVWEHLAGTVSAPFESGEHGQMAVKVIDDRGNELMVVKSLKEASK